MSLVRNSKPEKRVLAITFLVMLGAAAIFFLSFRLALNAPFMFDDAPNLEGLSEVAQGAPAIDFIAAQTASTLGRPLAMASFLINLDDWPDNPSGFRLINLLAHWFNSLALGLLAFLLAKRHLPTAARAGFAISVSTIWLLHPFLASTVLSIVQRMAILSATFTILGLCGYAFGRMMSESRPRAGLALMSSSLFLGTLLGTLAKENGALLPAFAALIELTVFSNQRIQLKPSTWLAWKMIFLLLPITLLVTTIANSWPGHLATYAFRDFTLSQRVATQAVILLDYVKQILIPDTRSMGLFHDDYPALRFSDPSASISTGLWVFIAIAAIAARKRLPILTLAVAGFLIAHSLESSILPLELYYEHRNYLASAFLISSICYGLWKIPGTIPILICSGWIAVLSILTISVTHLWGTPLVAALWWHEAHPRSPRAAQFAADLYLREGYVDTAYRYLSETGSLLPQASDLMVQTTIMECAQSTPETNIRAWKELSERLPTASFSFAVFDALSKYENLSNNGACPGIGPSEIEILWKTILSNPKFAANHMTQGFALNTLARRAAEKGDLNEAEELQLKAYTAWHTPENASMVAIRMLEHGKISEARIFIKTAIETDAPKMPWLRDRWLNHLKGLDDALLQKAP